MTKKEATRKLFDERSAMCVSISKEDVDMHYEKACHWQSSLYPQSCGSKDCRYCFLTRERNNRIRRLEEVQRVVSVTINGNVNITVNKQ